MVQNLSEYNFYHLHNRKFLLHPEVLTVFTIIFRSINRDNEPTLHKISLSKGCHFTY